MIKIGQIPPDRFGPLRERRQIVCNPGPAAAAGLNAPLHPATAWHIGHAKCDAAIQRRQPQCHPAALTVPFHGDPGRINFRRFAGQPDCP